MNVKTAPEVGAGGARALQGYSPRSEATEPTGVRVLMAVPFLAVAMLVTLFMLGVIGDRSRIDDMPMSMPLTFGAFFGAAGVWLVVSGIRGVRRQRRVREGRSLHPAEPWRWEHPWQARVHDDARRRAVDGFVFPLLWFTFLVPFHLLFGLNGTMILLDLAGAVVLGQAIYLLVRYLRFGRTELELGRVPFHLGETFEAALLPTPSLAGLERVTVTLRCIEERTELRSHGKKRTLEVIGYELYADTERLDASALRDGQPLKFSFALPTAPARLGSCLSERPPRFWELTVESEVSGVDYHATFLVPIYASVRGRSIRMKKLSSGSF